MIFLFVFCKEIFAFYSIGFQKNAETKDLKEIYQFKDDVMTLLYPCINTTSCTGYRLVLPQGKYKFEVWGAKGGNTSSNEGGSGGYSVGEIEFTSSTVIYANIGAKGSFHEGKKRIQEGGFNGGGNGRTLNETYYGAGAGGSSDIRILRNSVHNRVIVAGGGGGAGSLEAFSGGTGGGLIGGNGKYSKEINSEKHYYCIVSGGNQTNAGISQDTSKSNTLYKEHFYREADFFYGGSFLTSDNTGWSSGGGGGGWYGGARGCVAGSSGAGGSGFVFTSESENSQSYLSSEYHLKNAKTIDGITYQSQKDSLSSNNLLNTDGDGAIRITFLEYSLGTFFPQITCKITLFQSSNYWILLYSFASPH